MTAPENVSMETLNSEIQGLLGAMFRPVEFHGEDAEACAYMYSAVRALLLYVSNQSRSGALGSTDTANINRNVTACVQDVRALRDQFSVLQRNMNEVYAMASQNSQSPQRQDSINVGQRHEGVEGQVKNIQQALNLTEQRIRDLSIRYEQDLTDLQSEQRRGTDFRIALENRIGNVERSVADRFNAMQNDINRIVEQCEMVSHSNNRPIAQDHGPVFESMNARLEKIESRLEVVGTSKTDPKFTDTLHALIEENDSMKMTMSTFGERLELILHQVASSLQADIENLYAVWDLRKHEVAAICKSGNTRNKISLLHSTPAFSDLLSKNVSAMTAPGVPGMARSPRNSFMAQPLRSPRGNFAPGFGFGAQVNSAGSPRSPQGSFMGTPLSPRSSMQRQTRHVGIEVAPNKSGGVIVTRVVPNSAASEANIRIGDVLTAIEGNRVDDVSSMVEAVRKCVSLNSSFTVTRLPAGMNTIPENVRCVLK